MCNYVLFRTFKPSAIRFNKEISRQLKWLNGNCPHVKKKVIRARKGQQPASKGLNTFPIMKKKEP